MTKSVLFLLLALAVTGCSKTESPTKTAKPAADGTAIELAPAMGDFPLGLAVSQGFALHLFDTPGANQGFRKTPPESGAKRHFDEFTIAGKPHLVLTEESNPPRFYFDENRNGDLTDDRPPAVGEGPALVPNHYAIHIRYDEEKVVAPYRFWLFGSNMGGVRFYPKCYWHGTITVKEKPYAIVAFDANADGDYGNDPLIIDVNGNDKADAGESLTPGASLTIDGQQVTLLAVSRSGLTARFRM